MCADAGIPGGHQAGSAAGVRVPGRPRVAAAIRRGRLPERARPRGKLGDAAARGGHSTYIGCGGKCWQPCLCNSGIPDLLNVLFHIIYQA